MSCHLWRFPHGFLRASLPEAHRDLPFFPFLEPPVRGMLRQGFGYVLYVVRVSVCVCVCVKCFSEPFGLLRLLYPGYLAVAKIPLSRGSLVFPLRFHYSLVVAPKIAGAVEISPPALRGHYV